MKVIVMLFHQIGPRLTLQLLKIESGLFNGEVLHHELGGWSTGSNVVCIVLTGVLLYSS